MAIKPCFKLTVLTASAAALTACSAYGHGGAHVGAAYEAGASQYSGAANYAAYDQQKSSCPFGLGGGFDDNGAFKSRYGYVPDHTICAQGGYWVYNQAGVPIIQHQIVDEPTPALPAPTPITIQACPDGQYRTNSGTCAVLITEEPDPIYAPISAYPVSPELPVISYQPIRK